MKILRPSNHETKSLRFGHLPRVEISDDDGNIWLGFNDSGTPIVVALKTQGPALVAETEALKAEQELELAAYEQRLQRRADLLAKASAGVLTPAEIQEAIAGKLSADAIDVTEIDPIDPGGDR